MKLDPVNLVHVFYQPEERKIPVGRLALKDRRVLFEYDSDFVKLGLQLSPLKLPLQSGVIPSHDPTFNGLFGVFNDSLPDGWGRLLLDRALMKRGLNPGTLSVLDRLCFVGHQGMGALVYEPEASHSPLLSQSSLDEIAKEIRAFQEHDDDRYVEDLLTLGGSSAGARPKVLMSFGGEHWLIKFPSSTDHKDIGAIEYAYHLMAKAAGLDVPRAKLFPSRNSVGFFGSLRFDRQGDTRVHVHTLSGLLHADHRVPSLDYATLLKATMHLTKDVSMAEKLYRQGVFNVLAHNRDDHAKNFSYSMDGKGHWRLSPAYDLTFSSGPGGEHCTLVMGEGKTPGKSHLLELAVSGGIKKLRALGILEEVQEAVCNWSVFAREAGVTAASKTMIQRALERGL